ncbi:MAG: DEAD/DEAH box helicase, partial [Planctomycetes bacterium]|nr:DEAD/DEAH box helicase [Planctomycetota bacterium]
MTTANQPIAERPLTTLAGIGPKRAEVFARALGVRHVGDLLRLTPRSYRTPGPWVTCAQVEKFEGQMVRIEGSVQKTWKRGFGRRVSVSVRLEDDSGTVTLVWFHQPWLVDKFTEGRFLQVEGKVSSRKGVQILSPRVMNEEEAKLEGLQPIYPQGESLSAQRVGAAVKAALSLCQPVADPISQEVLKIAEIVDLATALQALHAPSNEEDLERGRRRLAFGEVLKFEQKRIRGRAQVTSSPAVISPRQTSIWERIHQRLPFSFTEEQKECLAEIRHDLQAGKPMSRLLHGEVGSGKTAVAFAVSLAVAGEGGQVALVAPTEILARQHVATFRSWLQGATLPVVGVFGEDSPSERRANLQLLADNKPAIAIGTHALFSESVRFGQLELVVIDEQHRFGVRQKGALVAKGTQPHVLTMTATPIPRTLAWAQYGALAPSVLRQRPGTGGAVNTLVRKMEEWPAWLAAMGARFQKEERAFVVVPTIDGDGGLLECAEQLRSALPASCRVEVVHGRLPSLEVQAAVERFRASEAQILLGTTVVEVGLDVPNIQHMAILQAGKLGWASLHQLRG